ncbi:MAG: hypothetical protein WDM81_01165 [Rhizomicrobium sp.]
MDMQAGDYVHALMNNHDWYRINTPLDYFRAGLWCMANLVTSASYFLIPNEIKYWRKSLPFGAASLIINLFIGFIAFCGLSHLAMIAIMPTGPWWATLLIYLPMAIVSAATVAVIRLQRQPIVELLASVAAALKEAPL